MNIVPIISVCIAGIAVGVSIISFFTGRKDKSSDKLTSMETSLIKLNIKLDQLCNTTNETRTDIKAMDSKLVQMDKEVELLKLDVKTAFIRIDEIKETLKK